MDTIIFTDKDPYYLCPNCGVINNFDPEEQDTVLCSDCSEILNIGENISGTQEYKAEVT